jgi:hypothetical protein
MNTAIDKELEKHGIDKEHYLARRCTLHRIREMRKIEPGDVIPSGMIE